jgi:nitrate/nitrite-specific signal transduction histidine kinase
MPPYEHYGQMSLRDILREHWQWMGAITALIIALLGALMLLHGRQIVVMKVSGQNRLLQSSIEEMTIRLLESSPKVILRIEDDGRGFDVKAQEIKSAATKRIGILSMQERVNLLQGQMTIHSQPMKGTTILIKIPIQ